MTDDNVRPESNPSRESRPESPDEGVVDEVANEGSEATGEVSTETEPVTVAAPDAATESEIDAAAESDESAQGESPAPDAMTAEVEVPSPSEADTVETEVAESGEKTVTTPGVDAMPGDQRRDTFIWHPEHQGKSFDEVRAALAQDIAADQRQHRLAMDGAEESEQEALASVVSLERKWGKYDFDWAEQEPDALADRIVDFERERERRHQMISWTDYRDGDIEVDEALVVGERPGELSTSAKGLSLLLVVLLIVVILLAVWAL